MNDNNIDNTPQIGNDFKNIETAKNVCETRSCNLDAYNWLNDFPLPENKEPFYYAEVRFKHNHRDFFSYSEDLTLQIGDIVAVESDQGHDIGLVVLTGDTVRFQMKRKGVMPNAEFKKIYRKARLQDIEKWIHSVDKEKPTLVQTRQIIRDLKLDMKLNDLEFRGDGAKAIFYYTATDRVDFRELIKILAERFRIKIEMKQIGVRQEAAKVGGIGSCGREMCCATWISSFQSVSTQSARTQQLTLNPQKLAGQCGKLKCCLNYEQDTYADSMRYFPSTNIRLKTKEGDAVFVKSEVFKKTMCYSYSGERNMYRMIEIPVSSVWEIIKMNENKQYPERFDEFAYTPHEEETMVSFEQMNQDDLTRFDKPKRRDNNEKGNRRQHSDHHARNESKNGNEPRRNPANEQRNRDNAPRNNNGNDHGNRENKQN